MQSDILRKSYATSEDHSIPRSNENDVHLLRYQNINSPSLPNSVDLHFKSFAGSGIKHNFDKSILKKVDSHFGESNKLPSDSTTASVLFFPFFAI